MTDKTSQPYNDPVPPDEILQKDYQAVFSGLSGERVLEDLMFFCGVFAFNPGEAVADSRAEGRRDAGLFILMRMGEVRTRKESL